MQDEAKTKEQLIIELAETRQQFEELRASETELDRVKEALESSARRDTVLADLSSQALRGWYIYNLLDAAVRLTVETLSMEMCGIFQMEKSGESLRLVAGEGWKNDSVGSATVGTGVESQAGYTVRTGGPVIVKDLWSEERFKVSPLLRDHGVVSGLSVPMIAGGFVFGVMGAHTTKRRDFSKRDVQFLETMANILTIAALRRQAVAALRQTSRGLVETKQYLTNVIETSTDAIVSTNTEGSVVLCNKGTESLLGYQRDEVIGQPVTMLYEREEQAEEIMRLLREGGGTVAGLETTLLAKDGSPIPVLYSASIFYDEKEQEAGSVRFNRDLRDRKRWEQELEQVNEEIVKTQNALEQAQAEANAAGELRKVNEELNQQIECNKKTQEKLVIAEKLATMGRLTAGVSHEIMNPLNVITMRLHMLLNDPHISPEILKGLRILDEQAKRIAKITEGLLDYARKREPNRRKLDLNEAVKRTLNLIEHDFRSGNITVVLGFAAGLPPVCADHDQLQQVVLNLLTNARDAMPYGGQLTLSTNATKKNGWSFVEIRVEDTGEGIAPKYMDKLFDPFFTTKPEGEGTGLGLSICQGIVEAHGGSIKAESVEGRGAIFRVELPLELAEGSST